MRSGLRDRTEYSPELKRNEEQRLVAGRVALCVGTVEDALTALDSGWRKIVTEIGVQFAKPEAVELFAANGQKVDGETVFLDPEFVLELVAIGRSEFVMLARNHDHVVLIGGDSMVFSSVYGPPFFRHGTEGK